MTPKQLFHYYNGTVWKNRLPRVKIGRQLRKGVRGLLLKDQIGGLRREARVYLGTSGAKGPDVENCPSARTLSPGRRPERQYSQ
jgi:hypothetical protein